MRIDRIAILALALANIACAPGEAEIAVVVVPPVRHCGWEKPVDYEVCGIDGECSTVSSAAFACTPGPSVQIV